MQKTGTICANRAEAGGAIADSIQPGNIARHPVATGGVQLAPDAPFSRNASAFDVAAADHEVRGALEGGQQAWYVRRLVGEVSVHLENDIRVKLVDRVLHAADVGGPQTRLCARDEVNVGIPLHHLTHQFRRAVGRIIIDHQQVHVMADALKFVLQRRQ